MKNTTILYDFMQVKPLLTIFWHLNNFFMNIFFLFISFSSTVERNSSVDATSVSSKRVRKFTVYSKTIANNKQTINCYPVKTRFLSFIDLNIL